MAVTISWTKNWSASDDGTVFGGADLENLQTAVEGHSHTSGIDTFLNLSDTPSSFTGKGSNISSVNSGASALEFSTVSALLDAVISSTQGSVLYRGASTWDALAPGTSGHILKTQGAAADPIWVNLLGTWSDEGTVTDGTSATDVSATQASSDGVFIGYIEFAATEPYGHSIKALTDSSNPPTTVRGGASIVSASNASSQAKGRRSSFCVPVKKNDYYKADYSNDGGSGTALRQYYFIPLGA